MVNCPLCEAVVDVDEEELDEGDELTCEECGGLIRVTGIDPVELESAEEDDEDDDDDVDFDDDEDDEDDDEDADEEDEDWK